jgi:Ca2+-binding RTX toxin-like protein
LQVALRWEILRRMARRLAGIAVAALAVLALPSAAGATVFCDYIDAGPDGPAGNVLAVTSVAELDEDELEGTEGDGNAIATGTRIAPRRDGSIAVLAPDREPVECSGGKPTVTNIDGLRVVSSSGDFVFIDLQGGALAPGATDEGNGSSEIEISFAASYGALFVRGGSERDHFAASRVNDEGQLRVNLNPQAERREDDGDITVAAESVLALLGGAGADRMVAAPEGPDPEGETAYLYMLGGPGGDTLITGDFDDVTMLGGAGADVLRAGPAGAELEGGTGDDELFAGSGGSSLEGGDGDDLLFGGAGRDLLTGDGGNDRLQARGSDDFVDTQDGERDSTDCGPGRDRVRHDDDRDHERRCERRRPRRHHGPLPLPPGVTPEETRAAGLPAN